MKILLVEDDVGIGRFISQGLRARGCDVRWEREGRDVVALAGSGEFNTIILDLLLPDSDGIDLCADIRAADVGTPILILTARTGLDDRLDGFAAGADDYLRKPFAFAELIARVEVLLRRDGSRKPDPITYGRLVIDPLTGQAEWEGRPVEAGRRTKTLLLALARASGDVVGRDALIEEIWGNNAEITDNSLDVCVSALRRILKASSVPLEIKVYRGQGVALRLSDD
ncbi:response regulator transcription factor [Parasphingopyxis sp. CP4]|uniref:response regulator transcription factor n=1 Tax=Parasphingopyxis sp. CP4 TaxID=2724527 RepID=UPI0015A44FC3|nr:response regulator transcription factor [Parasphingopyxis sp. CP4]QLC22423.1 response regulator transcription factor [Parasphingopyxis sp. CP4]